MRTIVVGIEQTDHATEALRWALREARLADARLVAVHAWTRPLMPFGAAMAGAPPGAAQDELDCRGTAERVADRAVAIAGGTGEVVEVRTTEGPPADVLLETARTERADLLVVGTSGRGGIASLLLGSVSEDLARHPPCPLVIVPAGEES